MQKWHNRILFHYADILWAVMHRDYRDCVNVLPKKCSSCFKNIQNIFLELSVGQVRQNCCATLVIPPGTSVATIVTICCNHRDGEYFLHRITRKLGSTATSTVITRPLPLTNYISDAENETQRALLGHTNGSIEMRSPSAAAMLTMVAAATIVRFPPVYRLFQCEFISLLLSMEIKGNICVCFPLNTSRPRQNGRHFQTTISNTFCSMKIFEFRLRYYWSLLPRVQSTIFQHWFR